MNAVRRDVDRFIDRLSDELLFNSRIETPIDKGRARNGWRKEKTFRQTSVVNRVPYIGALERGHSKQAPRGITTPAINKTLRKIK